MDQKEYTQLLVLELNVNFLIFLDPLFGEILMRRIGWFIDGIDVP